MIPRSSSLGCWDVLMLTVWALVLVQCAGTFTNVPMHSVSSSDLRDASRSVRPLGLSELRALNARNYEEIARQENLVPLPLARIRGRSGAYGDWGGSAFDFAIISQHEIDAIRREGRYMEASALAELVARAQRPLAQRLERVGRRIAAAAGRPDLTFVLDPSLGFNAGVPAGFDTRQIHVGPQVVVHDTQEDGLAFILGHEVAHILHGHAKAAQIQQIVVTGLKVAAALSIVALNAIAVSQGASGLSPGELERSAAGAATLVGGLATTAVRATGYERDQEREADYFGAQYALQAGYRADAGVRSMEFLLALDGGAGIGFGFLKAHPPSAERLVRLGQWTSQTRLATVPAEPQSTSRGAFDPVEKPGPPPTSAVLSASSSSPLARPQTSADREGASPPPVPPARAKARPAPSSVAIPAPPAPATPPTDLRAPAQTREPSMLSSQRPVADSCWSVASAGGERCTTCCRGDRCETTCAESKEQTFSSTIGVPRPAVCWNADSRSPNGNEICTTCCTADVSCETKCSEVRGG